MSDTKFLKLSAEAAETLELLTQREEQLREALEVLHWYDATYTKFVFVRSILTALDIVRNPRIDTITRVVRGAAGILKELGAKK